MSRIKKYAMYLGVAVFCAVMKDAYPEYIPQLILFFLLVWRIEDGVSHEH